MRGEPKFIQIITIKPQKGGWELSFQKTTNTYNSGIANDAKVQARTLYSQTAVWVQANGELCTTENKDLVQL